MNQFDYEPFIELDQWFSLEGYNVVSDDYVWTTKPCHNIFKKTNDYFVRSALGGDNFYPLGEIICCS
jgi:hypothetical protein